MRTADENYITARWCAGNQLNTDFLWLAVHALEKYFKAVLLVNGLTTRGYGHDIVRLHASVRQLAGPLMPERLLQPPCLEIYRWYERTTENFIEHLLANGNADNRYAIYGFTTRSQDLHMLDTLVFAVRRLVCNLERPVFPGQNPRWPDLTHRELLTNQPEYYGRMFMPLDNLVALRDETPLRHAALNLNFSFAPDDYPHMPVAQGHASSRAVIIRRILEPLASDRLSEAVEGIDIALWFLENVQVPKGKLGYPGVREAIEVAIEAARMKHGLMSGGSVTPGAVP